MKLIQKNKKAFFDYEILQTYLAGMMLRGSEIKSVRAGQVNLKGSYISLQGGEAFLKGANISRYPYDQAPDYDPLRMRKLLLSSKELEGLERQLNEQGVTLIPLAIGLKGPYAKLEIGVARGKKKYDKRQSIKEKESKRRALRGE